MNGHVFLSKGIDIPKDPALPRLFIKLNEGDTNVLMGDLIPVDDEAVLSIVGVKNLKDGELNRLPPIGFTCPSSTVDPPVAVFPKRLPIPGKIPPVFVKIEFDADAGGLSLMRYRSPPEVPVAT